ncbi:MAG: endonuclease III [Anaerolineales bacterium]|nr:endonuclease III [Anaerolineales bacterium]
MTDLKKRALQIHETLIQVYGEPIRENPMPAIHELVGTILSQNTTDANCDRAFAALLAKYPTWELLRDADEAGVIEAIRPAGLANQKGPRILAILKAISEERGELDLQFLADMPVAEARKWLTKFKGVGPKTAAIVLCFALGMPAFPVDTHVYRVTGRIGLRPAELNFEQAHAHLESIFPVETYYPAHLNLIRLGRQVCHARKPNCPQCPVRHLCDYKDKTV